MSIPFEFDPAIPLRLSTDELSFEYGPGLAGPTPELRRLDAIRPTLRDPGCSGPDPVYGIAMDIHRDQDLSQLQERMLLFGAVVYAAGQLGREPVRSQGHVHAVAAHSGWSPPEIFEIWSGTAIVYAQQTVMDDPGICMAVTAHPGQQVVVPPGWAHCVINADPTRRMAFGAWCDRQYGFEYAAVRARHGLAWFPILKEDGSIGWEANPHYALSKLETRGARAYSELGLDTRSSLYRQFIDNPDSVMFVAEPQRAQELWPNFVP